MFPFDDVIMFPPTVSEFSRDSQELRQYEAPLLTVCNYQDLFVPSTRIKVCHNNIMTWEPLNTLLNKPSSADDLERRGVHVTSL